jgi:hypothetical protein
VGVELPAVDGAAVLDELVKALGDAVPPHPLRREMRIELDANNTMLAMALRASCMGPSKKLFGEYADLLDASIEWSTYFDLGRIRRPTVSTLRQSHREEREPYCFRMFAAAPSESRARTKVAVVMKNSQRQSQSATGFPATYIWRLMNFFANSRENHIDSRRDVACILAAPIRVCDSQRRRPVRRSATQLAGRSDLSAVGFMNRQGSSDAVAGGMALLATRIAAPDTCSCER